MAAKSLLKKLGEHPKQRRQQRAPDLFRAFRTFFVETGSYMQKVFPIGNVLLECLSCLDPLKRDNVRGRAQAQFLAKKLRTEERGD